jgi:hypothetical protein
MAQTSVRLQPLSREIKKGADIVGLTDRAYDISTGAIHIDEILVKGDLSGDLTYNGRRIRILTIDTAIGMKVDQHGARGPIWEGVDIQILN